MRARLPGLRARGRYTARGALKKRFEKMMDRDVCICL